VVEVGKDFWRSLGLTLLIKQGHLELIAQEHVHLLKISKDGDSAISLGNLFQVSGKSYFFTAKKFPYVQTELLMFEFVPTASCPVMGHHWKEPGSIFFMSFF